MLLDVLFLALSISLISVKFEMPETVKSLKKENDLLKSHIDRLREEFKNFQEATTKKLQNLPNDDMTVSSASER